MASEPVTAGCGCLMILWIMMIVTIPLSIIGFWIWMIIHCCKYQQKDRTVWMLVTILGGPFGGIVYFFNKEKKPKM